MFGQNPTPHGQGVRMDEMKFTDAEGNDISFGEMLDDVIHQPQPHTILGKRGQQIIKLKNIELCECFLRGMLDGGTKYDGKLPTEKMNYHHMIDLVFEVEWLVDFDPVAIMQSASCHMEKVLGIYPNVPKLHTPPAEQQGG